MSVTVERVDAAIALVEAVRRFDGGKMAAAFEASFELPMMGDLPFKSAWDFIQQVLAWIRENADNAEQILDTVDMVATILGYGPVVKPITAFIRQLLGLL